MAISTIGSDGLATSAVTSTKLSSGVPTTAQLPAGTVLQVVSVATGNRTVVSAGGGPTATDVNASITPTASSSKILVIISANIRFGQSVQDSTATILLYKNGSGLVQEYLRTYDYGSSGIYQQRPSSIVYLDSPATTSSTNYRLYLTGNNASIGVNDDGTNSSSITLMEIAA